MKPGQTESTSHFNKDTHQRMKTRKPGHYHPNRDRHGSPFWYIFHMEMALAGPYEAPTDGHSYHQLDFLHILAHEDTSPVQAHTVWLIL